MNILYFNEYLIFIEYPAFNECLVLLNILYLMNVFFFEYLVFNDSIVFRIKLYRLFDVIAPATRFLSHRMPPVNHFFQDDYHCCNLCNKVPVTRILGQKTKVPIPFHIISTQRLHG